MSTFLPPVVGKLLGDTRDYSSKLLAAGKETETETTAMSSRFDRVKTAVGEHAVGISAAAAGIAVGFAKMGAGHKLAFDQLDKAIDNSGQSHEVLQSKIDATVRRLENLAIKDVTTANAMTILTNATHDPTKAIEYMGLVADIAAAKHITLEKAAGLVANALNGGTKLYKLFNIQVEDAKKKANDLEAATKTQVAADENAAKAKQDLADLIERQGEKTKLTVGDHQALRDAQANAAKTAADLTTANKTLSDAQAAVANSSNDTAKNLDKVSQVVSGQAKTKVDNFNGTLDVWRVKLERIAASAGEKVGPALATLATVVTIITPLIGTQLAGAIGAATRAAAPWILAIGAVVLAGYLLYRNWDTVTSFVKKTAGEVFDFVKRNFDMIAIVVTGPVAPLLLLVHHWREVFDAIKTVTHTAVTFIVDKFLALVEGMVKAAATAFGWIPGIGPKLKDAAHRFEDFRDDVNASLNGIHDRTVNVRINTTGSLPKDTAHAKGIPEFASGGTVPGPRGKPTLAVVHGGEVVVPPEGAQVAPMAGATSGGASVIHVHFHGGSFVGGSKSDIAEDLAPHIRTALIRSGFQQALGFSN